MRKLLLGVLLATSICPTAFAAYDSATAAQQKSLEIIRVTPSGEDAPAGRQIVITFNRPVVPIGKMERDAAEIPIITSPALPCEWRWINTSALACNLPEKSPLQEATKYTLDIKPGIKAEDGTTIAAAYHHEFITERPRVSYHQFRLWKSPGLPVLRLVFNQPVDKDSVKDHIYFSVGESEQRTRLEVSPDPEDRTPPQFLPAPGEPYGLIFKKSPPQQSDDQLQRNHGREARRIWLVEPRHELSLDTKIVLKTEPGLVSALGPEPSIDTSSVVQFDTYPKFEFLGIRCTTNSEQMLEAKSGEEMKGKCNPQRGTELVFSAPVSRGKAGKMLAFTPPIYGWGTTADTSNEEESEESDEPSDARIGYEYRQPHSKGKTYSISLPSGLKPAQEYHIESRAHQMGFFSRLWYRITSIFRKKDPIDMRDIFGRKLSNSINMNFALDHRNPNFVLDYRDAVLEKGVESEVPFYVNNLTSYQFDYRKMTTQDVLANQHYKQAVPAVKDVQFAVPFGVREMLGGKSGAIYGYLTTDPAVEKYNPPRLFAQVTPYQVHLKLGHFTSVAWVTDMATGQPASGARVSMFKDTLSAMQVVKKADALTTTDADGIALLPGTETLDPDLSVTRAYGEDHIRYFVRVKKGEDMALLPVEYSFEINNYRSAGSESVYPSNRERYGHMRAWGTTAQGIYRAGDTIQYKIYVRNQNNEAFIAPPTKGYKLKIIDPMGKVVELRKGLTLSAFGAISGEFTVPKEGAVGWYQFKLLADFAKPSENESESASSEEEAELGADGRADESADDNDAGFKSFFPMRVLVSDFTPAPFHVSNQLNGDLFHAEDKVSVTTHAELHSGGAYSDASARITAVLDAMPFTSKHPLAKGFRFNSFKYEQSSQQVFQKIDTVNGKGENILDFSMGKPNVVYGKLTVESAVSDDRGKFVSNQSRADYVGVDRLVGLHNKEWIYTAGKPAEIEYIVVDERGAPVKGTNVEIALERQDTKAARVKGAGNAYLTEYSTSWVAAGSCKGTSDGAALTCSYTPEKPGLYRAVAKIKDTKGREHSTTLESYVTGRDYVAWNNDENDSSLTVIPERTDYKIGDTARYLVKNPYPGAKALITIERYGVLDHFVQTFDSSTPVVEFKVKPDYVPGFYLSVVIMSPRVEKPLGEGNVDLGKPTFRMGYVGVPVKDPYKEMVITAKADREVYKPREKVTVQLHAEPRVRDKNEPVEIAVTVLDESVFDLITGGKANFDPYEGFYKLESLDLRNYSLLTRLVGRQKFEKKGANPGGDGGADLSMRSIFKFVSYWNAELKTDKNGNATATFDAPDNLTGWRVLAIATTPTDRFGLGEAKFKVNRPTELRPVMPNQVLEGDKFDAGFSVMNRTDKPRTINVTIHAEGNLDTAKTPDTLTKSVTLEPYKRTTVLMPIQTTAVAQTSDVKAGELRFSATAEDDIDGDGIKHSIPVNKHRSLDVAANYGTTTQDKISEPIAFPKEMLPDVGGISVVASPTVIGNLSGAFKYMRDYPYICWEQKLSKGVMASHYKNLKAYLPDKLMWEGSDALPQETLAQAPNFQAPNGGMTYFLPQDKYVDPYLSAYTALAFNWLRKSGYTIPGEVETKLQTYLSGLLKNDAVPEFYSEGMTSTVRAVALAALAERGKADMADLERYQPFVPKMSLLGKSYFLQAALAIKGGEKYAPEVANMILATANQTGGKFVFSETWDDSYRRILASPMRENCAVLDAFVNYGERESGKKLVADVPFKLVRTITQTRANRDHWENTQENMFCMNALIDFARVYEKDKPAMKVSASMDGKSFGEASFKDVRDPAALLERPVMAGDAGRKANVEIERTGTGRLYYATRLMYALPPELSKSANAGIEIHREYSVERDGKWELLKTPAALKRGELVRVDLYVSVPAARNFVVVDDPVPGGLEPVNRELATSSIVDAQKGAYQAAGGSFWFKFSDWQDFGISRWAFYHQEIRHDAVRYYSDYLPAGNYHLSYTAQAVATGDFTAMPTIAGEMYDPDVYGKTEGLKLGVSEADAKQQ